MNHGRLPARQADFASESFLNDERMRLERFARELSAREAQLDQRETRLRLTDQRPTVEHMMQPHV